MSRLTRTAASAVVGLHGLIHLMGAAAYLQISEVQGLPFKTTVLGGRWDLGAVGVRLFGASWALVALGLAVSAIGLYAQRSWYKPMLVGAIVCSMVLTGLDWNVAFAGVIVNLLILAALVMDSRPETTPPKTRQDGTAKL